MRASGSGGRHGLVELGARRRHSELVRVLLWEKSTASSSRGKCYAMILRAIEGDNTKLDKCDRASIDSIRNHTARHFPVQDVAMASYREILER